VHELSICGSIADLAARHAAGRSVKVINVRVGQLRQIVPDTLVYCWELVSAETSLAGSRIAVEEVPARIRCRACEHVTDVGWKSNALFLILMMPNLVMLPNQRKEKSIRKRRRGRAPDGAFPPA
jgi:hydrogenase nickel incorporation protein HypA/HybF